MEGTVKDRYEFLTEVGLQDCSEFWAFFGCFKYMIFFLDGELVTGFQYLNIAHLQKSWVISFSTR